MPGDLDAQKRLTAATDVPVNVLAIGDYRALGRSGIAALGAARISIGAGLTRVTAQVVMQSTTQMLEQGDFTPLDAGMPFDTLDPILSR
jgi:2-methylisocitrate lyase-like PEP mutase family enzyme